VRKKKKNSNMIMTELRSRQADRAGFLQEGRGMAVRTIVYVIKNVFYECMPFGWLAEKKGRTRERGRD
jgi:hypothetical protein